MKVRLFGIFFVIALCLVAYGIGGVSDSINNKKLSINTDSLLIVIKKQNEYINLTRLDSINRIVNQQREQIAVLRLDSASKSKVIKNKKSKVMKQKTEMIITATFKGQNGSLGYIKGTQYELRMTHAKTGFICIQHTDVRNPSGYCQYESMIAFLRNWTQVNDTLKPKPDKKDVAINFTDFCKDKTANSIHKALSFYKEEFKPEKVLDYFQNWSLTKSNKKYRNGVILTNNTTQGWKVKVWINDNSEYTFLSGTTGTENPEEENWQYFPKTISEFISDCLRYEDVELLFSKTAIKKIYG